MSTVNRISPHQTKIEEIPVERLIRDERVQRAINPHWVRKLSDELNLDSLGTFIVNRRDDGSEILLDGGHRAEALLKHGFGEWPVSCVVHEGLDLADEARLFLLHQNRRAVTRLEKFRISVVSEDPNAVQLNKLIHKHGFSVTHKSRRITCIDALESVYEGGHKSTKIYPKVVDDTLRIIVEAWTPEGSAPKEVVMGVGYLLHRYPGLDQEHLAKRLSQVKNGAKGVVARTRYHLEMKAAPTMREAAIRVISDIYNERRRTGKLT